MKILLCLLLPLFFSSQTLAFWKNLHLRTAALIASAHLPSDIVYFSSSALPNDAITCNGYWGKTGHICHKAPLLVLSQSDKTNLTRLAMDFHSALKTARSVIEDVSSRRNFKPSRRNKETLETFVGNIPNLKTVSSVCFEHMAAMRSSALCTICSGHNYKHFFGSKALISGKDCGRFLNTCQPFFQGISEAFEVVEILLRYLSKEKKKIFTSIFTDEFMNKFVKEQLAAPVLDREKAIREKHHKKVDELSVALCNVLLRIREKPLVINLVWHFKKVFGSIATRLDKRPRELSMPKALSRSLEEEDDEQEEESFSMPDALVIGSLDDSETSIANATLDNSLKPMNLSLEFP